MKKEDGASNFFSNFNDRVNQSVERAEEMENKTLPNTDFQGFGNKTLENKFERFNNNQTPGIINPLTGVAQQSANDIPMTNGTGSARPNFDESFSMGVKEVNEGAPMSNVLFKKK
jgi:hypothetical protein